MCGGCASLLTPYDEQLKVKEQKIKNLFNDCLPLIPSPKKYYYRNRMDFAFGHNFSIGLKDAKDNIINIDKCLLMSDLCNAILNRLRYFISWKKLGDYKSGKHEILRHVIIREGKNIKNTILNIITSDKGVFPLEDLWEKISNLVQGVTWSINTSPADRSYGEIQKSFGADYFLESLNGIRFKVPVQSFFQTNTLQAENLIKVVQDFAGQQKQEIILDLYSGTGSIGLSLAGLAEKVIGIEENVDAANLSLENAKMNNINNYSAIAGKAEDTLGTLDILPDLVVVDPPRPGVHKRVLAKIAEMRPKSIIYVSCNPDTQKHDIDLLKPSGYKVEKVQPLDMFPHTPHIENVALLLL